VCEDCDSALRCRLAAQAALVELLEESGLPPLCAALAAEEDADRQLGAVLAEAVQVRHLAILPLPLPLLSPMSSSNQCKHTIVSPRSCRLLKALCERCLSCDRHSARGRTPTKTSGRSLTGA
jgi:hypothetical protein